MTATRTAGPEKKKKQIEKPAKVDLGGPGRSADVPMWQLLQSLPGGPVPHVVHLSLSLSLSQKRR